VARKKKESKCLAKNLLGLEKEDKYADLNVTMAPKEGGDILKGVPPVRLIFV